MFKYLPLIFMIAVVALPLQAQNKQADAKVPPPDHAKPTDEIIGKGDSEYILFSDLEATTFDPVAKKLGFNDKVLSYEGKQAKLVGYMAPFDDLENLKKFILLQASQGCQFCVPPSPFGVVYVVQNEKTKIGYQDAPVVVEGLFQSWKEGSEVEGHKLGFVFSVENAKVYKYEPK